jgi:hypothetical protein
MHVTNSPQGKQIHRVTDANGNNIVTSLVSVFDPVPGYGIVAPTSPQWHGSAEQ